MKIIVVDDDIVRSNKIKKWLIDNNICEDQNIDVFKCTSKARAAISKKYYDAMILDVVLPKRDDEKSTWINGIELLRYLNQSSNVKKPERIIGITAFSDDIQNFKAEFEKYCLSVVEVKNENFDWEDIFSNAFAYYQSSKIASIADDKNIIAITIHGIRTFGSWQDKFKKLLNKKAGFINVQNYKYGYFWTLSLMLPFLRSIEVNKAALRLNKIISNSEGGSVYIFAHSFGTFLIAKALEKIIPDCDSLPPIKLVLAGSILPSNYDWSYFTSRSPYNTIINDCGNDDYVLWLSEALVPFTGMAGRTGFYGLNDSQLCNRYHKGSHSHYFNNNDFMEKFWAPLFWNEIVTENTQDRPYNIFTHGILEQLIIFSSRIKLLYPLIIFALVYYFYF